MRYHSQNLTDGKLPLWRHGRAWWRSIGWEWSVLRSASSIGFAIGRRHASVRFPGFSFWVHGPHDDTDRRAFEVRWMDGSLWLAHPWVRQDEWRSADPWWKKEVVLHVVDWMLGPAHCSTTKGNPFEIVIPMPEGSYRATATPESRVWRRRWYWPTRRRDSVWLDIAGGIPHSGKGENDWDCGDDGLWGCGGETIEEAIGNAVASVLRNRRRYGYDSKDTGRHPVLARHDTP